MAIPLLASSPANSEASQIVPTINGVIQSINNNALIGITAPTSLRNIIYGGDFNTNPWQRGTTFTGITNATTYTADRFYGIGGASSSISVSKQTTSTPVGFGAKLRFGRAASNADTTAITLNYIVESNDVFQMQGQPFVLSFWAQAGANYSAASNKLAMTMTTGTTADEGNSAYNGGTWTGKAAVTLLGSAGTSVTGVTLTSSWQRFAVSGFIPAAALEVGITWSQTPVGTAGASDFFEIAGVQLEVMPQGGNNPTPFERRPLDLELRLCWRYYEQINEVTGVSVSPVALGMANTTAIALVPLQFRERKRVVPTITYPKQAGVSTFALQDTLATVSGTAAGTQNATSTVDVSYGKWTASNTVLTAGHPVVLVGQGGSGAIKISSEL